METDFEKRVFLLLKRWYGDVVMIGTIDGRYYTEEFFPGRKRRFMITVLQDYVLDFKLKWYIQKADGRYILSTEPVYEETWICEDHNNFENLFRAKCRSLMPFQVGLMGSCVDDIESLENLHQRLTKLEDFMNNL